MIKLRKENDDFDCIFFGSSFSSNNISTEMGRKRVLKRIKQENRIQTDIFMMSKMSSKIKLIIRIAMTKMHIPNHSKLKNLYIEAPLTALSALETEVEKRMVIDRRERIKKRAKDPKIIRKIFRKISTMSFIIIQIGASKNERRSKGEKSGVSSPAMK
ncbi:hypothetical protein [Thermoflavimicrobium daqui]|uniref:hypothetical protein n=1 Tax=Thermoflavimicrobium daqui TaxID=2137476 RepID=UPI0011AB57E8|nr:hypothetical protein [Thermoflavimicrobium daqui]